MTVEGKILKTMFKEIRLRVSKGRRIVVDEWPVDTKKSGGQRSAGTFQEATGKSLKEHVFPE